MLFVIKIVINHAEIVISLEQVLSEQIGLHNCLSAHAAAKPQIQIKLYNFLLLVPLKLCFYQLYNAFSIVPYLNFLFFRK